VNCFLALNILSGIDNNLCFYNVKNYHNVLKNIIKVSANFDYFILCNDSHTDPHDNEFKYLPKHLIKNTLDTARLDWFEKEIKSENFLFLEKKTLSPLASEHCKKIILGHRFDQMVVGGFSTCIDILPTSLGLIDLKQNVKIYKGCVGDFSDEMQRNALEYLDFINLLDDSIGII